MTDTSRPESITGGCLCRAIRFTIKFPNEKDWPPIRNGICHCTMCRKHSGSLFPQNFSVPRRNVHPSLDSASLPTFKTYQSSPKTVRGFCSTCGSPLTFLEADDADMIEINLGSLDEEVLCGKRDEENAWEDEVGRHVPRKGGYGKLLADATYHIFSENEIPGLVSDEYEGEKYLLDQSAGKSFRGKARDLKRKG